MSVVVVEDEGKRRADEWRGNWRAEWVEVRVWWEKGLVLGLLLGVGVVSIDGFGIIGTGTGTGGGGGCEYTDVGVDDGRELVYAADEAAT